MTRQQPKRWRALLALGTVSSLAFAACAGDDDDTATDEGTDDTTEDTAEEEAVDLEGEEVTVFGVELEQEQQSLNETFEPLREESGMTIEVSGSDDFETEIVANVQGGNPPDIAMVPQPGLIQDFADDIAPLSDDVLSEIEANFDPGWTDLAQVDGEIVAVPVKADLKSLVWYNQTAFEDNNYEIPETFEDFLALTDQMMADGNTPFCLGLGSEDATGWPATDWLEDWVLRRNGPEVYDQWRDHEIPFNDPEIVETMQELYDLWSQEGFVAGGLEPSASESFREAGLGITDGSCMMYRMSNFYAALLTDPELGGLESVGPDSEISAFYLPGSEENPNITLTAGLYAVAFNDDPATMETMRYIASTEYADTRAANPIGGFLSPNANVDTSLYQNPLEQEFGEILASADPARFDASDIMPGPVGTGTFWEAMVNITAGDQSVDEAFDSVEDTWRDG